MARKRDLTPKERALWDAVAKTTTPNPDRKPKPVPSPVGPHADLIERPKHLCRMAEPAPPTEPKSRQPAASLNNLDRRTADRFRRGQLVIDGRIDLHGLTRERAHGQLKQFIAKARVKGWRTVLVITGTGRGRSYDGTPLPISDAPWERSASERFQMPTHTGVLRREVPLWLDEPDIRPHIVAVTTAQPRHGGAGALYVYLRRNRD